MTSKNSKAKTFANQKNKLMTHSKFTKRKKIIESQEIQRTN